MTFQLITDSCCNLPDSYVERFNLKIMPLTFMAGDEQFTTYTDGRQSDLKQFYDMMRQGTVFTTSLPSSKDAEDLFRDTLASGHDVLYLGFSSALSGTYEAMSRILDTVAQEFPERKALHVDTLAASLGQGSLVYQAGIQAENGASIDEVYNWVVDNRLHAAHWFTVDDLMFLFRGGRVSRTSARAGTILNIKPVMHVDDEGRLIPISKVRGRKKSIMSMLDKMRETALQPVNEQVVFISHGDCLEDAEFLAAKVREEFGVKDVVINYVDPVIGAHSGPGTLALFFMADHR